MGHRKKRKEKKNEYQQFPTNTSACGSPIIYMYIQQIPWILLYNTYVVPIQDYEYLYRTLCFIDFSINNAKEYIILNITITTGEFMFEWVLLNV